LGLLVVLQEVQGSGRDRGMCQDPSGAHETGWHRTQQGNTGEHRVREERTEKDSRRRRRRRGLD